MKNLIKILAVCATLLTLSCINLQNQKAQMASDLYERIKSIIYNSNNNSFTPEWLNIEKRILDNQDTLFYIENSDFKIMVTMRHNMVVDSIKTIQDSVEQQKTEHKGW